MNPNKRLASVEFQGKPVKASEDRLSEVPEEVMQYIFRLLEFPDAIRFSSVSRSWRHAWLIHQFMVFHKGFIEALVNADYEYVDIINSILSQHIGPIVAFVLDLPYFVESPLQSDVDRWMAPVWGNNLQMLALRFPYDGRKYKLPPCFFTSCNNLYHLDLKNCIFEPPSGFKSFPRLLKITLKAVAISQKASDIVVNAPQLQNLLIKECFGLQYLNINAPWLEDFVSLGSHSLNFSNLLNCKYLQLLVIPNMESNDNFGDEEAKEEAKKVGLDKLFCAWKLIQHVAVCGTFFKSLMREGQSEVPRRLSRIADTLQSLHCWHLNDVQEVACALCVLRSAPNVRAFQFMMSSINPESSIEDVVNYLEAPDCLSQRLHKLEMLSVKSYNAVRQELNLIKLIFACSPMLKTVTLEVTEEQHGNGGREEMEGEVMRLPHLSNNIEVIFDVI